MIAAHYIEGMVQNHCVYVTILVQIKRKEVPNLQRSDFQFFFVIYMKEASPEHLLI